MHTETTTVLVSLSLQTKWLVGSAQTWPMDMGPDDQKCPLTPASFSLPSCPCLILLLFPRDLDIPIDLCKFGVRVKLCFAAFCLAFVLRAVMFIVGVWNPEACVVKLVVSRWSADLGGT